MEIIVAGAGIVGVSTAIWLQRAGHAVTLVDREGPGRGTSHGNGGVLAAGAVVPVTTPGLMRRAPGMLFSGDQPLFLRWSYLPRLLPFLTRYLSHANDVHVRRYAAAMGRLLHDSVDQHAALCAGTDAEKYLGREDYCFGYATRAAFDADGYGWGVRRQAGVRFDVLGGAEYATKDPVWGDAFGCVVRCRDHGRISDPGAYVRALADHFVAQGGILHLTEITDINVADGDVTALLTSDGLMTADRIIFALGPWSKRIAHKLGVEVPFESERGYHIELTNPSAMPVNPVMVAAGKFVVTPMDGRIRAAGVIEFGGLDAPPSRAPFDLLRRQMADLLPGVTYDDVTEWMGHRPAPADSLPLIGANTVGGRSYSAFGHQHVGLTGGPKTGRIIADLIGGRGPNIDLAPFDPQKHVARQVRHPGRDR
ncbi:NAD(P)/FAD-dependent oxidoreductase [Jannaschia donghaensis]|uniref:D-amino acid dehydrogenase small subunit n=1 Tax=Jannaschia donghaensis TaxID=420998 RepID=A0A0M6YLH7_9RHOB|nr:FAD-dependent oxidoreductase [Jannaschia donghaensis]CTQ51211.1 D-amino acid dehydrogenase small subunit [Jannaschia donghaensis]